jgi:hypothetical protein
MNKTYFVESEMCDRVGFQNESDRNEMALALYEEHIYFLTMRIMNWYSDGIMRGIEEDASSNVHTWDAYESFDVPTQVAFWDIGCDHYCAGIAYRDEIICACCGGVTELDEIYESAPYGVIPIVAYRDWIDFAYEIIGENEENFSLED